MYARATNRLRFGDPAAAGRECRVLLANRAKNQRQLCELKTYESKNAAAFGSLAQDANGFSYFGLSV
jgi:hypothetical protein